MYHGVYTEGHGSPRTPLVYLLSPQGSAKYCFPKASPEDGRHSANSTLLQIVTGLLMENEDTLRLQNNFRLVMDLTPGYLQKT